MGYAANEVCDLKSIAILKVYDNLENPYDSHEYQECVCIQLHFVLICRDLIAHATFIFFSSVTMSFHKDNQGHGVPVPQSRHDHNNTLSPHVFDVLFCSPGSMLLNHL